MDYFNLIGARRSVRAFSEEMPEAEKIQRILESANRAPSAGNLQAYEIYVVRRAGERRALARASLDQHFLAAAPIVLVFCTHPARSAVRYRERGEMLYAVQDATIACTFAMLAAVAEGLGTVWVGAFNENEVRRLIGAPPGIVPIAMLPIGYAAEKPELTPRRNLNDLVHELP